MLNNVVSGIKDKFESILAVDLAMAIIHAFGDEHRMVSQNLINMHLSEELKEAKSTVILTALFSLILQAEAPHIN